MKEPESFPLEVAILNHASALVRFGECALLSDPWFEESCFSGGWGLRYRNPQAYELAASATHLWISHWHSDHLHVPTLTKLAQRNPRLRVLANVSANFSMVERLRNVGFGDVMPLLERRPLSLTPQMTVTRYPTAGIDNMLHLTAGGWSVLNYNDCNLTLAGVRRMAARIGRVDVLLTSYNHAGKLFQRDSVAREKDALWQALLRAADLFEARHVVPFASSHFYRNALGLDAKRVVARLR